MNHLSKKSLLLCCSSLLVLGVSSSAFAQHDVQTYVSQKGIDFIAKEAPTYVPKVLHPPAFQKAVACMDFEQRNTTVNVSVDDLKISMPQNGMIRVEIELSGDANGEIYADDIYACFGEVTCQDSLDIRKASAVMDFELMVVDGKTRAISRNADLNVNPNDIDFELDDCGFTGSVLTTAIDFTEEWLLGYIEDMLADLAQEHLGPMVEDMLDGFSYEGSLSLASYKATLTDLNLSNGGLAMGIDADILDRYAPAPCVEEFDKGGPADLPGAPPDLTGPNAQDANLTFNLGLVNKGFYTFWRRGLLCLTEKHVKALGVELDFNMVGALLPGFPTGSKFSFELGLEDYPRIRPHDSDDSQVSIHFGGVTIDLHGDRPDGTRNTMHAEVDMSATATLGINPTSNAIVAQLDGLIIERMVMEDERKVTGDGFDVARITQMVHDHILPKLLHEIGPIPLTGPTFAFGEYAVILKQMTTNDAYLTAGIDLFKIPNDDSGAPDTEITDYPTGVVNPKNAIIKVQGTDPEIPSELLQYQTSINGEAAEPNFVHSYSVGEAGKTGNYVFTVAAMDLNGNIDPSPVEVELTVDGIAPQLVISGRRIRKASEGPAKISWTMSDDLTDTQALPVRVEIYEVEDPKDALATRLLDTIELPPGSTTTTVELNEPGGLYRVEVHVTDEAGNDSQSSMLLTVPSEGGCSVGGGKGASNMVLLLLALGMLVARRRRQQ